ncbi:MAG TPA: hypothetical protein VMM60_07670 [Ilumatobacter sp.]|nr:hypothetical protein [Ilumatobacter sp.]
MAQQFEPTIGNESNWVRSLYVYAVCLISMVVILAGAALTVTSAVTIISPSTGLSSGWERVLVGGTSVVEEGMKIAEDYMENQRGDMTMPEFCEGDINASDEEYCASLAADMEDALSEPVIPDEVDNVIALVRDEVLHQVRMAAIGKLVIGLLVVGLGLVVFGRHKGLTALYQTGPSSSSPVPPAAPTPVPVAPTVPVAPPGPTPPAPPAGDWSASR